MSDLQKRTNLSDIRKFLDTLPNFPLLKQITLYTSGTGFAQALMALYAILLTRQLEPAQYAIFIACYASANLTSFFFNWGLDTWYLRHGSIHDRPVTLTGAVLGLKTGFAVIWGIGLLVILPRIRPDVYFPGLLLVCVLDVFMEGCFTSLIATLNVTGQIRRVTPLYTLSRGGRLVSLLILIGFNAIDPLPFAVGRMLATLVALVAALWIIKPDFSHNGQINRRAIWRQSLPYGLSEFLATIYIQADITLLTIMSVNKTDIGNYSPATALISALFIIPNSVYSMIIPVLSRSYQKNPYQMRAKVLKSLLGFLLLGAVLFAGVFLCGKALAVALFTQKYLHTGELLVILSPIIFLKSIEFGAAAVLVAITWQARRLGPQVISALLNVGINIMVIPFLGSTGVAWAYVISEAVLAFGYLIIVGSWFYQSSYQTREA